MGGNVKSKVLGVMAGIAIGLCAVAIVLGAFLLVQVHEDVQEHGAEIALIAGLSSQNGHEARAIARQAEREIRILDAVCAATPNCRIPR